MTDQIKTSMVGLTQAIKEEERKWLEDNSEDALRTEVREKLDKQKAQLLVKYLGFEKDSWKHDVWKIDHCNSRSGNSVVGKTIKEVIQREADMWLVESVREMIKECFNEHSDLYDPIKKEVKNQINYKFKDLIREEVKSFVREFMRAEVQRVLQHHDDEVKYMEEMIGE